MQVAAVVVVNMEETLSIHQLPLEVLIKILSYLDVKEVLEVARVNSWFNEISKHPTLWWSLRVDLKSTDQLISFCNFFTEAPYLQRLSLKLNLPNLSKLDFDLINFLFKKLVDLNCLDIECRDLGFIVLPSNLRHLQVKRLAFEHTNDFVMKQFSSVRKCLLIDSLHLQFPILLYESSSSVTEEGRNLLKKYESSLKSLKIQPFSKEWIPLIKNLQSLEEISLPYVEIRYESLLQIAMLPHLQALVVPDHVFGSFSRILEVYPFPELKKLHLKVRQDSKVNESFFNLILAKIPKLERFCITGSSSKNTWTYLYDFIECCKLLLHFCCDLYNIKEDKRFFVFIEKLFHLSERRQFKSICLCGILFRLTICGLQIPVEIEQMIPTFSCGSFHNGEDEKSSCFCSFPGEEHTFKDVFHV